MESVVSTTLSQGMSDKSHWNKARKSVPCAVTGFIKCSVISNLNCKSFHPDLQLYKKV